ncbi:NAD-dependent epimerase/dehydratase family protein [Cohnella thailandensis]|uniref:SDR family oxidoreductase n=1 Tax=Cohnella thailandensis TaxID=557557 RepID=A0A841SP57_9BACL|nr:SDR family oxidoreductase [Cohnella thailandensis]MBB6632569.1 SDR family oxidoreductase [Cohnella thailandensis]MBP1971863.1 nucleoside-diphosphate-sugar epimerase [Cohnella thailandensis]
MAKTIMVTGAGGYIGSVLVPKLLDLGYKVKAIDRFFFGEEKLQLHPNLMIIKDDTRWLDPNHFAAVDAVIDLVAISNDPSGELFQEATYQVNHISRVNSAIQAQKYGVGRYILPSSCSIYGFRGADEIVDESSETNPLTTYAKANEKAEQGILPLASDDFVVTVIRQATVYGVSPRMRFDLAINGMVYGAWDKGVIPLMRDGNQWRPMVHVQDTTDLMCLLIEADSNIINGEIFNVGSDENNYKLGDLAEEIVRAIPKEITIEWYGDPDHRSYRVGFDKVESVLGWKAQWTATRGALEIYEALESGSIQRTPETITLNWYTELMKWHQIINRLDYKGIIL